jgi:hypothetical protein
VDNGACHLRIEFSKRFVWRQGTRAILALKDQRRGGELVLALEVQARRPGGSIRPRPLWMALAPRLGQLVIPTAFSVVAIKQFTACNRTEATERRIRLGVDMLLNRVCVAAGWNSGNSVVYGVALPAHVEATAIALLALQDEKRTPAVQASLDWLRKRSATIESVESLAWCILTLFVYQEPIGHLQARLATLIGDGREILNNATLALPFSL